MEILIKLRADKKPRIGIAYLNEYEAGKAFQQILETYPKESFVARLEIFRSHAHFTLYPVNGGRPVFYRHLSFKPDQVKKLQTFVSPKTEMEFVHIYKKGNMAFVAKVKHNNPVPLVIERYDLLSAIV